MDRPAVLLQCTAVHKRLGAVRVRTLVRALRCVSSPMYDQVASSTEVFAANLALENCTQFLFISALTVKQTDKSGQGLENSVLRLKQFRAHLVRPFAGVGPTVPCQIFSRAEVLVARRALHVTGRRVGRRGFRTGGGGGRIRLI